MAGVFVEGVNIRPHQSLGIKLLQLGAQIVFRFSHHLDHRLIHIDNVVIGIGHHDIGRRTIERAANTRIFLQAFALAEIRCEFHNLIRLSISI